MGRISATVADLESALAGFRWFRGSSDHLTQARALSEGEGLLAVGEGLETVVSTLEARSAFERLQGLTGPVRRAEVAGRLLSKVDVDTPKRFGLTRQEYLTTRFGEGVSFETVVAGLTRGFRGIGSVKVTLGPNPAKLGIRLLDRGGRFFGEVEHWLSEDPDYSGFMIDDGPWIEVAPARRGQGVGTRLFVNSVVLLAETGRYSRFSFFASMLGPAAWSSFGGLSIKPANLTRARQVLRHLNHRYKLGIPANRLRRPISFDEMRGLRLRSNAPAGLIDYVGQSFERHKSWMSRRKLEEAARFIGLVALLDHGFSADIDIRPGARGYEEFLLSLRALRRRGKFRFTAP